MIWLAAAAHCLAEARISEFMALNSATLADQDGDYSDWIELFNPGPDALNLRHWGLTDDASNLDKWSLPSTNLEAGGFLVVFASGKDRATAGGQLHTNFKLDGAGEYLALVHPDGTTVACQFAPQFPEQRENVSFGLDPNTGQRLFFTHPTPGATNDLDSAGVAESPLFSIPGGVYTSNALSVALSVSASNAIIRYTLNGTEPNEHSIVYSGPLALNLATVVRARAFLEGLQPSPTVSADYVLLGSDVLAFSSNLPLMIINTFGRGIPDSAKIPANVTVIDTLGGRAALTNSGAYDGLGGIATHGSSSLQFPKKSYSLEFRDELGEGKDVPVLGLPKDSDWVLYAPYSDKTLMRNVLAYELHGKMGHYAVRTRFIEVFTHLYGGKLAMRDYAGVYVLTEKIKRGMNRVDVAKLGPADNAEPEVTGGYIIKKDRLDPGDSGFSTSHAGLFGYVEPKESEITPPQKAWLAQWFRNFETALYGASFRNLATGYPAFIDVGSFIDNYWIVEMSKNIDGFRLSNYMHKDRLGKLAMDPIWDWNLSFGNANYADGWQTTGWYQPGGNDYPWFTRLFQDVDFKQAQIDRWAELRKSTFDTASILARVDEWAAYLNEAQIRNFQKWRVLGAYVWPNQYIGRSYGDELSWMKQWITGRLQWIDSQFLQPPVFARTDSSNPAGFLLVMSAPKGLIRYTLDGSDPRLSGAFIAPGAALYSSPIPVTNNLRVIARALYGATWSAPTTATFVLAPADLKITEIMYHPADPTPASPYSDEDFEFIEMKNAGATPLALTGVHFTNGVEFSFTGGAVTNLGPGQYVLIVKNLAAFAARYGTTNNVAGQYSGSLNNSGERLTLEGPLGQTLEDFSFKPSWSPATDGYGFSLVAADENASSARSCLPSYWRPSARAGGSPGSADPAPTIPPIWINEALISPAAGQKAFVEIYNPNRIPVDIGNWLLTSDRTKPRGFQFASPTLLAPGGYLALTEQEWAPGGVQPKHFQLGLNGGGLYLYSADSAGNLTGYSDSLQFGASQPGVGFRRYQTSLGQALFPAEASISPGGPNSGPISARVIINEIRYHPAPGDGEFVELKNLTDVPVKLYDPEAPTNHWKLSGAGFEFPPGAEIPARGFLVLAGAEPSAFRLKYGIAPATPVFELYPGVLRISGEPLALLRPGQPETDPLDGSVRTQYFEEDAAPYSDTWPWPAAADGAGASLERVSPDLCGDDPANWRASSGTGSPGRDNGETYGDWQSRCFSADELSDASVSGADADPDHDGQPNYAEFLCGTDPRDPASCLRVQSVVRDAQPSAALITFPGAAHHTYTLQWRASATSGAWLNWTNIPPLLEDGPVNSSVPLDSAAPRFYRLAIP